MKKQEDRVAIVAVARTALGPFGGTLKDLEASHLAGVVIQEALQRCRLKGGQVDEVILGNVYQAGGGPNPARIAAVKGGIPYEVPCMTVNKVCASGLKAVGLAAQAICCGSGKVIVAGGTESMSRAPYLLTGTRWGERMGHGQLIDSMIRDGLWDCFYDCHMGSMAELLLLVIRSEPPAPGL